MSGQGVMFSNVRFYVVNISIICIVCRSSGIVVRMWSVFLFTCFCCRYSKTLSICMYIGIGTDVAGLATFYLLILPTIPTTDSTYILHIYKMCFLLILQPYLGKGIYSIPTELHSYLVSDFRLRWSFLILYVVNRNNKGYLCPEVLTA